MKHLKTFENYEKTIHDVDGDEENNDDSDNEFVCDVCGEHVNKVTLDEEVGVYRCDDCMDCTIPFSLS